MINLVSVCLYVALFSPPVDLLLFGKLISTVICHLWLPTLHTVKHLSQMARWSVGRDIPENKRPRWTSSEKTEKEWACLGSEHNEDRSTYLAVLKPNNSDHSEFKEASTETLKDWIGFELY